VIPQARYLDLPVREDELPLHLGLWYQGRIVKIDPLGPAHLGKPDQGAGHISAASRSGHTGRQLRDEFQLAPEAVLIQQELVAPITALHPVLSDSHAHPVRISGKLSGIVPAGMKVAKFRVGDGDGDRGIRLVPVLVYNAERTRTHAGHQVVLVFEFGIEIPPLQEMGGTVLTVTGSLVGQDLVSGGTHILTSSFQDSHERVCFHTRFDDRLPVRGRRPES